MKHTASLKGWSTLDTSDELAGSGIDTSAAVLTGVLLAGEIVGL